MLQVYVALSESSPVRGLSAHWDTCRGAIRPGGETTGPGLFPPGGGGRGGEGGDGNGGGGGGGARRGGDAGVARPPQQREHEVAAGGHRLRGGAGADRAGVLAEH